MRHVVLDPGDGEGKARSEDSSRVNPCEEKRGVVKIIP